MTEMVPIEAELRARAGKGVARATRRAGKVPAVIYGARQEPTMIALDPKLVMREMTRPGWKSRLYELKIDGKSERALMRDIQLHPVSDRPEHVDFQRLAPGEKIRVAVVVHFLNEATCPGLKKGGVLNVVRHAVEVWADPDSVPASFDVDLGGMDIGETIRFSTLTGTEGVKPTIVDRDFVIATVAPPTKAQETAATAEAAAPAPAAAAAAKTAPQKK